ncbi:MAG: THUMP-like domain-containing protein [Micrococcales bacterium]
MDREDFVALMSPAGQQLLGSVEYDSRADLVQLVSRLRAAGHEPALVAAVLTQLKLRHKARAKFGDFAQRMILTEPGLEQASRLLVAALHAGRFRSAGAKSVADLGCGIGAESLAFAGAGIRVSAYDIDEVTAAAATFNLLPFDNAVVEQRDVTTLDLNGFDALFFDPARRELGGAARAKAVRKYDPDTYQPNFDWVVSQCRGRTAGIKTGPGHPHEGIPQEAEAQWVSVGGDLVELGLWFGGAARPGVARSALLLSPDGSKHELNSPETNPAHAPLGPLSQFIFEPDNAVVRSHLIGQLAVATGTHSFSPEIAYLTGSEPVDSPWLRSYRLIEDLPFDRKKLKAQLRQREIGVLEIKKRGADIVPEQLRKELALKGSNKATLIVTRVADTHRALLCEAL